MIDITFASFPALAAESPQAVALVCHGEESLKDELFARLDAESGGALGRAVALKGFRGEAGQSVSLLAPAASLSELVLVGCAVGKERALTATAAGNAGGEAAKALGEVSEAVIVPLGIVGDHAAHVALGARLNRYDFDRYRSAEGVSKPRLGHVHVVVSDIDRAEAAWAACDAVSQGVILTRDLVSEPPNVLFPAAFRDRIEELRALGLDVEVLDEAAMRELGFGALLGVAQGSTQRPYTVIVRHEGASAEEAPLAFVGKGVTFDSGGISIKPAAGMDEMKSDMAGAATVIGLMGALARRKAKINAVGVVGLVENMLSGAAQRPGDIVKSYDGKTIEVLNTDAEGRLVLADILAYTRQRFSPKHMIDLATLTGAIVVSLGHEHAGLFSNDDALAAALLDAGAEVEENLWRMPMGETYDRQLRSDIADMKNIGGRAGSAILAAQFLGRFVGDTSWAHLDIAGTAYKTEASSLAPKGATGFGVRVLDQFARAQEVHG